LSRKLEGFSLDELKGLVTEGRIAWGAYHRELTARGISCVKNTTPSGWDKPKEPRKRKIQKVTGVQAEL